MKTRAKPPLAFDDNPTLDEDFFARAKPSVLGENARLRKALEQIIKAHEAGIEIETAISDAKATLVGAQ